MKKRKIYPELIRKYESSRKSLAVLIDPDAIGDFHEIEPIIDFANQYPIDYFFIGGSLIKDPDFTNVIDLLKRSTDIPVIAFPGSNLQINYKVDAILLLSLISGRNPDYIIGQHVPVAMALKRSQIEVIPTGYLLIDGGRDSSVAYMSFTRPIPAEKPEIAISTAVAGELLGLKLIYLEAGSGAVMPVSEEMIQKVRHAVDVPVIVGGGLNSTEKALNALHAGADIIVVGNHLESNPEFLKEVSELLTQYNASLDIH